jgi:TRAP-type C4-dicarboxylate transport system permease small subunit
MTLLRQFNAALDSFLMAAMAAAFFGLIVTVFMQVLDRNVIKFGMIWTLDIAQLLFGWCVFVGAALAVRRSAHYAVELFPKHWLRLNAGLKVFADLGIAVIVFVLLDGGWELTVLGFDRFTEAIGITEAYWVAAVPVSAMAMALFLLENLLDDTARLVETWRGEG